jgi:hypothetical protein
VTSRVPAEWGKPANFFFGNRDMFKDMAADDAFPRWLRVTFAAYAHIEANGHAVFRQKRLAFLLGEAVDGVHMPAPRQRVTEAITGAVERGLLLPESKALCLVVPRAAVAYGVGDTTQRCPRHPMKSNGETVSPGLKTTRFQSGVSIQKERHNRVVSRSGPSPLSSSPGASAPDPDTKTDTSERKSA